MKKLVIVTYVLRALGFVLVLLMLFGHSIVLNFFPGLEGRSINPLFYTGIACYALGAVISSLIRKRRPNAAVVKLKRRRRAFLAAPRNRSRSNLVDD